MRRLRGFAAAIVAAAVVLGAGHLRATRSRDPLVVFRVATMERVAALTFDDGPDPEFTPEVLGVLDEHGVKATFFMIGRRMEEHPELVREVVARGHVIGNHTYSHPRDLVALDRARVEEEIAGWERVGEPLIGGPVTLFRPPRGRWDARVATIARECGYRTVLWSVCADSREATTPELMAARVLEQAAPGLIVLAHDGTGRERAKDVEATRLIIVGLWARGYRFVTVPELLAEEEAGGRGVAVSNMPRHERGTAGTGRGEGAGGHGGGGAPP